VIWLRKLLGLCIHDYVKEGHGNITNGCRKIGDYYIVRCTKCGHMKCFNFT